MKFQKLLLRYEPRETLPLWAWSRQAELSHVGGSQTERTAPPPMVAHTLHCANPLLTKVITIRDKNDLQVAHRRPSWIRAVNIDTNDATIGVAALTLDGVRSIQCTVVLPLSHLSSSRVLKILDLRSRGITNDTIMGLEFCRALEDLSLRHCDRVTSVTRLAASKCGYVASLRSGKLPSLP
jgi:hypothetical protein